MIRVESLRPVIPTWLKHSLW